MEQTYKLTKKAKQLLRDVAYYVPDGKRWNPDEPEREYAICPKDLYAKVAKSALDNLLKHNLVKVDERDEKMYGTIQTVTHYPLTNQGITEAKRILSFESGVPFSWYKPCAQYKLQIDCEERYQGMAVIGKRFYITDGYILLESTAQECKDAGISEKKSLTPKALKRCLNPMVGVMLSNAEPIGYQVYNHPDNLVWFVYSSRRTRNKGLACMRQTHYELIIGRIKEAVEFRFINKQFYVYKTGRKAPCATVMEASNAGGIAPTEEIKALLADRRS